MTQEIPVGELEELRAAYEQLAFSLERLYCQNLVKDEKYWEEDRALIWKYRRTD